MGSTKSFPARKPLVTIIRYRCTLPPPSLWVRRKHEEDRSVFRRATFERYGPCAFGRDGQKWLPPRSQDRHLSLPLMRENDMKSCFVIAACVAITAPAFTKGNSFGSGGHGGSHSSDFRPSSPRSSPGGDHSISGYTKGNGTYVAPSHATNPNGTKGTTGQRRATPTRTPVLQARRTRTDHPSSHLAKTTECIWKRKCF
jgi:hypothetical protein